MTRIAHLSDLHLVERGFSSRQGMLRRRLAYLSFGRRVDAEHRRERALAALREARSADHVVVTGDLTEDGIVAQFEMLAEVLHESGLDPSRVTLVPGNHDLYDDASPDHACAFTRALEGPLRPWAETSRDAEPVVLREAVIVPVSTAFTQPYTKSAGAFAEGVIERLAITAEKAAALGRALVLAMHHPPSRRFPIMQWIDGLAHHAEVRALLEAFDHAHVIHGHIHVATSRSVRPGAAPRVFSTEAVVDGASPLRFYAARRMRLVAEESAPIAALAFATT